MSRGAPRRRRVTPDVDMGTDRSHGGEDAPSSLTLSPIYKIPSGHKEGLRHLEVGDLIELVNPHRLTKSECSVTLSRCDKCESQVIYCEVLKI